MKETSQSTAKAARSRRQRCGDSAERWLPSLLRSALLLLLVLAACRSPGRSPTLPPAADPPADASAAPPAVADPEPAAPTSSAAGERPPAIKEAKERPSKKLRGDRSSRDRRDRRDADQRRYTERGVASWYGPGFHGRRTANGERFDMRGVSAAHKTLPFDTLVRVHNLDNGRTLDVRINDRGPFVHGRIIDLSRGAARKLDLVRAGVAEVEIEVIKWPAHLVGRNLDPSQRIVQVASFRDADKARELADTLRRDPLLAQVEVQRAKPWHRVRVVDVTLAQVKEVVERLRRRGFEPLVLRP